MINKITSAFSSPAKLEHYFLILVEKIARSVFNAFFYTVENALGFLVATLDRKSLTATGEAIFLCRHKNSNFSDDDGDEKLIVEDTLKLRGKKVHNHYWNSDCWLIEIRLYFG